MKFFDNILNSFKDKKIKILFVLFLIGIILIFLSSNFDKSIDEKKVDAVESISSDEYIKKTEEKLKATLSEMLSGEDVSVMVTIENGFEYVYASENKSDNDVVKDANEDSGTKTQQRDSNENTYKTIKDTDGNETPLIVSEIMPKIRGVFVVCENGDDETLQFAIKSAVQTVLNISSEKIFVTGKY